MNRSMGQCIGIFLTTLILGAFICYGYEKWPDGIFAFCAPQNTSVWELSKIAIWPCVLAIFLCVCLLVFTYGMRNLQSDTGHGDLDSDADHRISNSNGSW